MSILLPVNKFVASLALCGSLVVLASSGAQAYQVESNGNNARVRVNPGLLRTTVYFNWNETNAISRNGGYVAAILGPRLPIAGIVAAVINEVADNAVASRRCLKITKYGLLVGPAVVAPGTYACR